jgi:hypothetical protein
MLYCPLWPLWLYLIVSTLSHKRHDFRVGLGVLLNIKRVFWFSLQLSKETFLILNRNERDVVVDVQRSSCKVCAILVRFS